MGIRWQDCELGQSEVVFQATRRKPRLRHIPVPPITADCLLLEFAGVIYDPSPWRRWLFQLVSRMGLQAQYETFHRVWDNDYQDEVHYGDRDYWASLRVFLLASGLTRSQTEEVEAAGRPKQVKLEQDARPFPGVVSALTHLANRGIKLVLIANVSLTASELETRLNRMQLRGRFQVILSNHELGKARDRCDRARLATSLVGKSSHGTALVSSNTAQLRAAAAAGNSTIAFNYDTDAQANVYLEQFDHLLHVIQQRYSTLSMAS